MKKDNRNKQPSGDFKHNPFKSLKGFTPKPPSSQTTTGKEPPPRPREDDSAALFLRAVGDVKKLNAVSAGSSGKSEQPAAVKPKPEDAGDKQLFLQAVKKLGAVVKDAVPDEEEKPRRASPSSRLKQLRRGTIRISDELDLHGFLKDEALVRLERFVSGAYARGREAVLVITGKGLNSPDGPVLQGAVSTWLRESGKGMVAEFAPAPADKGGSGAFVVFLRMKM